MASTAERSEIDEEYKWQIDQIYATEQDWESDYEDVSSQLNELRDYKGRVLDDGETLLSVLTLRDGLMQKVSRIATFARMRSDEDMRNQTYQAMHSRAQGLVSEAEMIGSFIEPEIATADLDEIQRMVESTDGLELYEHHLDDIVRRKPHICSPEVERMLANLSDVHETPGDVYNLFTNTDMRYPAVERPDGKRIQLGRSNFLKYLRKHPNREFRQEVHEGFYEAFGDVRNTVGTLISKSVKKDVKLARSRNYDTAREASLNKENVPVEVYDMLVETVHDTLEPHHRHLELKREVLDVPRLQMWDVFMPIAESESPTIPYDEAKEYVIGALGRLGDEYQQRVAEGLDSRWVDVYPSDGKLGGIDYSAGSYDTDPYLLLNYTDNISSMTVMAHELGHSMHSDLANNEQPYVYSGYGKFVAEIASMVNEGLLTQHLLDVVEDKELRRHVVSGYLERFRRMLYGQALSADFDHRIHRLEENGDPLTPDTLDSIYRELKAEFYEPAVLDDYIDREWMRTPHYFFTYSLYQYATGMSAATVIVQDIVEEGQPAADRYLEFLSKGSRQYPIERLQEIGIDMTSPEPIERALSVYGDYVDEMESLMA